jgi:signal transduction histidine kinase
VSKDTQPTTPTVCFVVRTGKLKGKRFRLFPGMIMGRGEEAHLYIPDFKVSREHARVAFDSNGFVLEDLGSHNGTFLNGEQVKITSVSDGDILHLGGTRLEVVFDKQDKMARLGANTPSVVPTIMSSLDMRTPPTLDAMATEDFFSALGIPSLSEAANLSPDVLRRVLIKTRNFAIVYEITKAVKTAKTLDELLQTAMDFLFKVIQADRGYLILIDADSGELIPAVARHRDAENESAPLEISHTIIDWVMRERTAVLSSDAASDQRFEDKGSIVLYNIKSVLCVPMLHGETMIGLIQLDSLGAGDGFSPDDLELLSVIGPVLGIAVENTRLFEAQGTTIAELRAAHEKIVRAQQQLVTKERMAIVGRITTGLTHEIRNLMGPFMLADLLQEEYPDDQRIQDYANLMLEAYGRIGSLVEEIRHLSRGESPHLNVGEHDMTATIKSVVRFVKCDNQVKRHRLIPDCQPVPPFGYDENRIKQVLINLIRNATQSMESPGDIQIRSRIDPDDDTIVLVEVVDQGTGIPEDMLEKIWEPFFSTKEREGTGLGLDVCRGIVHRHSGTIECRSVVGVGTTMSVKLPFKNEAMAESGD